MLSIPETFRRRVETARTAHYAICWKIEQQLPVGSATIRLTNWPEVIELREEDDDTVLFDFTPLDGAEASASERQSDGDANNRECRGIISSSKITDEDLAAKKFDGAKVTEYLVDVRLSWRGFIERDVFYIRETQFDGQQWTAQCVGLVDLIGEAVGETYGPDCRVDVFSQGPGKCNANPANFTVSTSVGTVNTARKVFTANLNPIYPLENNLFDDGKLLWVTGANQGLYSDVKTQVIIGSTLCTITLQIETPLNIAGGDQFIVTAGCNKQAGIYSPDGHCKNRYNNLINIQAEPFIPGRDRAQRGVPTL